MSKHTASTKSYDLGPGSSYSFFKSQCAKPALPPADTSLAGQTVILTGGNMGIGYACAEHLVELKVARLILAVRTPSKGEAAAKTLRLKSPGTKIEVWNVDMLSYKSVQDFADKCKGLDRIDIAILNAGMTTGVFERGPEGHEKLVQTHYLSTVLLAHLLLPLLKEKSPAGKPGRLTIVSSGAAHYAKLSHSATTPYLPTYDDEALFEPAEQYCASKALEFFWAYKLVEYVRKEDVIVNLVDPGLVKGTGLHRDLTGMASFFFATAKNLFGRKMRDGASTLVDAAVVKGDETHGCYIQDWRVQS